MQFVLPFAASPALPTIQQLIQQLRRCGPLATAVLLHLAFLLALQNGLLRDVEQALPKEAVITLLASMPTTQVTEPAPTPRPRASEPAPVAHQPPAAQLPVTTPAPAQMPAPAAISMPSAAPAEAAPTPAAASVAAAPSAPSAAAPASVPVNTEPKTISSVEYLQMPQPTYPAVSRRLAEQGKVLLRILINEHGQPERADLESSSGFARLDEAARQAAMHALFKPHRENGRPIAVYVMVPIIFSLK